MLGRTGGAGQEWRGVGERGEGAAVKLGSTGGYWGALGVPYPPWPHFTPGPRVHWGYWGALGGPSALSPAGPGLGQAGHVLGAGDHQRPPERGRLCRPEPPGDLGGLGLAQGDPDPPLLHPEPRPAPGAAPRHRPRHALLVPLGALGGTETGWDGTGATGGAGGNGNLQVSPCLS